MMYSSYNLDRADRSIRKVILSMLEDRGIAYRFIEYEGEGRVFPDDFDDQFQKATAFLFEE